jgi:hypothetical protein
MELTLPQNPWVWIAVVVGVVVVVLYALSRPYGKLGIKFKGAGIEVDQNRPGISVGNRLHVEGGSEVGNITGKRRAGDAGQGTSVSVGNDVTVGPGSRIGDITGVDGSGEPRHDAGTKDPRR